MTEQQVIDQINIVVNRIAPKYAFGTYGVDDIKQEAFIICMDALNRYDQKRPLENFLYAITIILKMKKKKRRY
jgi:DNA-directed RNA polymerase specialized sigma subunit